MGGQLEVAISHSREKTGCACTPSNGIATVQRRLQKAQLIDRSSERKREREAQRNTGWAGRASSSGMNEFALSLSECQLNGLWQGDVHSRMKGKRHNRRRKALSGRPLSRADVCTFDDDQVETECSPQSSGAATACVHSASCGAAAAGRAHL
eukprot:6204650-Pleurochrysis_carterae.AAC.2